ncbi:MAG TPA: FkbM family methyltransferase [Candidatus Acidoferrum sp.]|nr:FkbM family methyltransferase [Candidatus Acidoferrum sp.]
MAIRFLARAYVAVFGRKMFYRWNSTLLLLAARGMCVTDPMIQAIGPAENTFLRRWATISPLTVFDVGANIGGYSGFLKQLCPKARIWAFEPHPETFKRLSAEAATNGFVAIQAGLSDKPGGGRLYDYASGSGSPHASLYREVIEGIHHSDATSVEVNMTTIDDLLSSGPPLTLNLLKVDAEGHELSILKGASKSIAEGKIDVIQFEFNEMNVVSRVFLHDFYEALPRYSFYRMVVDGLAPLGKYRARTHELFFSHNIVAIRDDVAYASKLT